MELTRSTGTGGRRAIATAFVALAALALWPAAVEAHGISAGEGSHGPAVPFVAAVGLSALLSLFVGLAIVSYYRPRVARSGRGATTRREVAVLLVALGLAASLAALTQQWLPTVAAGALGSTVAWIGRTRGITPHAGCADAALGAILTHRAVEGILVAGIYATNASFGLLALSLLTVHAIAEAAAVGGLYAPVSRGWGIWSVVAIQLSFVAGAVAGDLFAWVLPPALVSALLASVGGVLFVAGATEIRVVVIRNRDRLEA
ncbi:hypothetical protein [Natrinema salaciae]|uniref:Zinc transporter, ZIP family n=1 Tax=Natrinema salaciae TaxID=1186196 RepID=A0A1H8ZL17_9EURY|nr:hypothetical protein [Natrinema salaciae]SEP65102.1 hypothetical protein SAMN04489841_0201 [Natrinema salaciae]